MKSVLISFCFLLLNIPFFSQNKRITLQIKTDDKPSIHGFSYWQEIKISSKDTSFSASLHRSNPDVFKNLKPESYTVTISSLFNHSLSKKIPLNKKTPLTKITGLSAFYKRAPETISLSEKIKVNDTLFILYSSSQNEDKKEKLAITKTKTGYTAIQYKGITHEVFQEMGINETAYKAVIKFETDCKKANSPKAETAPIAEVYTIELNKEISSFIIPGDQGGLDDLKGILFIIEKK